MSIKESMLEEIQKAIDEGDWDNAKGMREELADYEKNPENYEDDDSSGGRSRIRK